MKYIIRTLNFLIFSCSILFLLGAHNSMAAPETPPIILLPKVDIVAHRGASGYAPENTMASFQKAVEMNVDYIELDVHVSKDGHLVVIHDLTVDRTTYGTGRVEDLTLEELKSLDAGSHFHAMYREERIPTLDEVLESYLGEVGILIEMKAPWLYKDMEKKVAEKLLEFMDKPETAKVMVQSFDHGAVKRFKKLMPDIPVAVLVYKQSHLTDAKIKEFSTYADYVNPRWDLITKPLVKRIHARNMKVMTWTDGRVLPLRPYLEAGVDGIITDHPDNIPRNTKNAWWLFYLCVSGGIGYSLFLLFKR